MGGREMLRLRTVGQNHLGGSCDQRKMGFLVRAQRGQLKVPQEREAERSYRRQEFEAGV